MLTIPDSIAEAARSRSGEFSPAMWLDIYADTGPTTSIRSSSQWAAATDPAVVNDTNVDATRKPGAIVLAAGSPVSPAATGTNVLQSTMQVVIERTDVYWYPAVWAFKETKYSVPLNDSVKYQGFTASSTQIIDDIIVASRYTGYQAMDVTVSIINVATGNQVGNSVTFTPTGSVARATLSGFAAGVVAGRQYRLQFIGNVPATIGTKAGPPTTVTTYNLNVELYGYDVVSTTWRIPFGNGYYLATGGRPSYATSGSFQRSMDVGSVPSVSGVLSYSDVIPNGCVMTIDAYYTDSAVVFAEAALTNWTLQTSGIQSGAELTAHRYWRFDVSMQSNSAQSASPELLEIITRFAPLPVTVGTTSERSSVVTLEGIDVPPSVPITFYTSTRIVQQGYKALDSVSAQSAQLSPQFSGSMIGSVSATLMPEPIVHALLSKPLKNKRVDVRAGYVGIDETLQIYSGAVDDLSFANNQYRLELADNFKIADVSVPSDKAGPEWAISTAYALNNIVVHGSSSYICILGHTSSATDEPGVGASWTTYWADNGTVWLDIDYSATHAADVLTDLLTNVINIPSERIDFASITAVKTALPNRYVDRIITKPTKATKLIGELAWLLESQFVVREGLLSLVKEPASTDEPVENIGPSDIITNTLTYRRGWRDLVNQGVIITGYTGDGDGSDKFTKGEVRADATSQTNYDTVVQKDWLDKWNVSSTELQLRLQSMLDRYSDGRRAISCQVSMRLLGLEPGAVVLLSSGQLPAGDPGPIKGYVIAKNMDFGRQTIRLTLLEV